MDVILWQMSSIDVENLRQVLEDETESLNRGSADEVICTTNNSYCSLKLYNIVISVFLYEMSLNGLNFPM